MQYIRVILKIRSKTSIYSYVFIVVYIGAKEIHVDLKQCMKLDVLDVNCWQQNERI